MSEKQFPVLYQGPYPRRMAEAEGWPLSVSWLLLEKHEQTAMRNHGGQSLEVLAERGGLSPLELVAVLLDQTLNEVTDGLVTDRLERYAIARLQGILRGNHERGRL